MLLLLRSVNVDVDDEDAEEGCWCLCALLIMLRLGCMVRVCLAVVLQFSVVVYGVLRVVNCSSQSARCIWHAHTQLHVQFVLAFSHLLFPSCSLHLTYAILHCASGVLFVCVQFTI